MVPDPHAFSSAEQDDFHEVVGARAEARGCRNGAVAAGPGYRRPDGPGFLPEDGLNRPAEQEAVDRAGVEGADVDVERARDGLDGLVDDVVGVGGRDDERGGEHAAPRRAPGGTASGTAARRGLGVTGEEDQVRVAPGRPDEPVGAGGPDRPRRRRGAAERPGASAGSATSSSRAIRMAAMAAASPCVSAPCVPESRKTRSRSVSSPPAAIRSRRPASALTEWPLASALPNVDRSGSSP